MRAYLPEALRDGQQVTGQVSHFSNYAIAW